MRRPLACRRPTAREVDHLRKPRTSHLEGDDDAFRLHDLDSGEDFVYTLVFPARADSASGKMSILAPLGIAVLGCRVGDTVEWEAPAGRKRLKVKKIVYQPEAEGNYHA